MTTRSQLRIALIPALGRAQSTVLTAIRTILAPILHLSADSVCLSQLFNESGPTEYYTCSISATWQLTANASRIRRNIASVGSANLPAPEEGCLVLRLASQTPRSAFDLHTLRDALPSSDGIREYPTLPAPKRRRVSFGPATVVASPSK